MRLYEIPTAMRLALEDLEVDDQTGEVLGVDALEAVEAEATAKIEATGLFIRELEADAEAAKLEAERLARRAKSTAAKIDRLKSYMSPALHALGGKVKTGRITISFRKSEAVVVTCPVERLPDVYQVVKTTVAPDKKALKEALKAGEVLDGVVLEQRESVVLR